jgi:hypothetical protein
MGIIPSEFGLSPLTEIDYFQASLKRLSRVGSRFLSQQNKVNRSEFFIELTISRSLHNFFLEV